MNRKAMSNLIKMFVLLTTAVALQGCNQEAQHRLQAELTVNTVTVAEPIVSQFRTFNGQTIASELTPLSFQVEGEISSMLVQEGSRVEQGQIIATIDNAKQNQSLLNAQSKLELALKQFERGRELVDNEMISKAEFDELNANHKLAKANLGLAKSQMKHTRLTAPTDGVIASVTKKNYENTATGETVATIYQDSSIYVRISLSDSVLATLDPESNASIYQPIASFTGHKKRYAMSYLEHTNELHPDTKTYELWLKMPQIEPPVLPGTSVTISVDMVKANLSNIQGYTLPMTAIDTGLTSSDFYVWKVTNGMATRSSISINQITSAGAIVASGIQTGDIVINSNLRQLREGMNVQGVQP